jgi:hypothetical protein
MQAYAHTLYIHTQTYIHTYMHAYIHVGMYKVCLPYEVGLLA